MRKYLLPEGGTFYKANLHTHTIISDGKWTPEKVKEEYSERGYSIVAFTDHDSLCPHNDLTDENFLAINGFETYYNDEMFREMNYNFVKTYHLSFFAKDKDNLDCPAYSDDYVEYRHGLNYVPEDVVRYNYKRQHSVECINRIIKQANKKGWLVSYNHPMWSLHNYEDYGKLEGLWGVEVYNTSAARGCMPDTAQAFYDFINQGKRIFPICADDMHDYSGAFGGFVMIKAEKLEYSAVLSAMERGDFYSSSGPEIKDFYIEDGVLYVECTPAVKVYINTERRDGWSCGSADAPITKTSFDIRGYLSETEKEKERLNRDPYIRLSVVDKEGNVARTRAYFLSEFIE